MLQRTVLLVATIVSSTAVLNAQERTCNIDAPGRTTQTVVAGDTIVELHDPFTVNCSDGAELRANSGRLNRAVRDLELIGNVFFQDSVQALTSDRATYSSQIGRLYATGNVVFVNRQEGSTLTGPELEYFRANEERPLSQVNAGQRPTLTIQPRDSVDSEEPLNLVADDVLILGEDDLTASGDVVITRSDLYATSGEARYNAATEDLELRDDAILESEEFVLAGEVVQARMADGSIEQVHARTDASLDGEDMQVTAPDLQLYFAGDLIQRAVATIQEDSTGARARATSAAFRLEADSLDALFDDQQLEVVTAIGSARGESVDTAGPAAGAEILDVAADDSAQVTQPADSLAALPDTMVAGADTIPDPLEIGRPNVLARDWIEGDTIIGYFERADPDSLAADTTLAPPAGDPGAGAEDPPPVELRRLVALGSAQSLYRMTPAGQQGNPDARPNVNFLVGERIELELVEGELQVANVEGLQQGVYLEALPPERPAEGPADAAPGDDPTVPDFPVLPDSQLPAPDALGSPGADDA
jgi:lipopolysaccharide export system protein LptA